jgi:hypothetical protein
MYNTKKNRYQLVVAKYDEDITWTNKYHNVKVYDKLNGDLPNVGRESHTYLTYIVENYHRLPEIIFFTQGHIDDHCKDFNRDKFIDLGENKFSQNFKTLNSNYYFYSPHIGYDKDHIHSYRNNILVPKDELGFRTWFKTYVDVDSTYTDIDNGIKLWWGGVFSVRCECILSRPKEYYKRLLDYIPKTNNPEVGHYFERSWFYIFNCHLYK